LDAMDSTAISMSWKYLEKNLNILSIVLIFLY
jgi:hypothetical protein